VFLPTKGADGFRIPADALNKVISSKTKALLYADPGNPTGAVYPEADLRAIAEILEESDVIVISDEIYDKLIYGNAKHVSLAQLGDVAYERTVIVNGVSKTYAMTGWRIGWAAGPKEIIAAARKVQSHSITNPNSVAQYAAAAALTGDQSCVERMVAEYAKRRDLVVARLRAMAGIRCPEPQGAFFALPNVSALLGKAHGGRPVRDDSAMCDLLLEEAKLAVVPGSAFGAPDHIRLSYATSLEVLEEGMNRLDRFVRELL
jgi:aspartate aminotransferase